MSTGTRTRDPAAASVAENQFLSGQPSIYLLWTMKRIRHLPLGVGGFWDASGCTHFLRTRLQREWAVILPPATTGGFLRSCWAGGRAR